MCRPLTRRELLRYAALVAATFPAARLARPGWSLAEEGLPGGIHPAVPMHLELVTVTDAEMVVTWFTGDPGTPDEFGRPAPVAAPGRLLLGTDPDPLRWEEVETHGPTPYHHVRIGGLSPGCTYFFRAESDGVAAVPTAFSPLHPDPSNGGTFTTLTPPPGKEMLRVAWLNDLHIGELVSGLALSDPRLPGGGFPPGFAADPADPYWRFMTRGAVGEAVAQGCRLLLANGDLTSEATPSEVAEARSLLDGFGRLGRIPTTAGGARSYFVTRGNHDRAHQGEAHAGCTPVPTHPELHDCFLDTFQEGFTEGSARFSALVKSGRFRWRFVGLDSSDIATGSGQLPQEELDFLEGELQRGDPTIPLFHHPAGDVAILTAVPPGIFGVDPEEAARFRALLGRYPNVAGVYNGHTHRNYRTTATDSGTIPYFEGGAVKEYPGGLTVVRLYEGGFMVNFWKIGDPEARAWSERSRGEYLGLYPYYTLGGLGDRNWVHHVTAA